MVLPGIQALFGFQMVAVFSQGFAERLDSGQKQLHLVALALVVAAIALVMAPAAYHRQKDPQRVTERFVRISTRLLLWSMPPLAVAITLDFYIVARVILRSPLASILAATLFGVFAMVWFVVPRSRAVERIVAGSRRT